MSDLGDVIDALHPNLNFKPNSRQLRLAEQIKYEVELTGLLTMVDGISRKCYAHCLPYPTEKVSPTQKACYSNCVLRWLEAQAIVGDRLKFHVDSEAGGWAQSINAARARSSLQEELPDTY
eukprot:TRINITY_DN1495_c0_g1_i3.p1 TRINITY_DN1495_c0_g1~~TRINITY_DN1495_c0_g1_i3.p1  ORF type:complete len:141 (-),score=27.93 TRINITY_DN1495_c0_g1_i3:179-541(-)